MNPRPSSPSCGDRPTAGFLEIREPGGKLLFRYDPERDLIEIQRRGRKMLIDLRAIGDLTNGEICGIVGISSI